MTDRLPTQEQIREFWEWYGFELKEVKFGMAGVVPQWILKDYANWEPPPIDLNNLFKYAVPKVVSKGYIVRLSAENNENGFYLGEVFGYFHSWNDDPALALFWAIWEVIKEEKKGE